MAVITQTNVTAGVGAVALTTTTLGSSDTLVYSTNTNQFLELLNDSGGSLTVTITGSAATTISPSGFGGTVSVAGGFAVTVADGTTKIVRLDTISAFLSGTITLTGASGLKARLFT